MHHHHPPTLHTRQVHEEGVVIGLHGICCAFGFEIECKLEHLRHHQAARGAVLLFEAKKEEHFATRGVHPVRPSSTTKEAWTRMPCSYIVFCQLCRDSVPWRAAAGI